MIDYCGTPGDITGLVSNACGWTMQGDYESVYQNGGAQCPNAT